MKRQSIAMIGTLALALIALLPRPNHALAQALADYTANPPFTTSAVPPNILLLLDNSGSMNNMAYTAAFNPSTTYSGLYDSTQCYQYSSNVFQPNPSPSTKPCSGSYPWDGNLLNYVSMREVDIVKWVMVGGACSVARDSQYRCSQVHGQNTFSSSACCSTQVRSITATQAAGLMPSAQIPASGNIYFHQVGLNSTLAGTFCVDDDSTPPSTSATSCSDTDTYAETDWFIVVAHPELTSGIIQQVGTKARFGLMEFNSGSNNTTSGDGGKVLNPVGASVSSMVSGIEGTTPSTWTPLAESLYEATRYYAQIAPAYAGSDYSYTVSTQDPYYFDGTWVATPQTVTCCKSFVIVFTDGQPTQDLDIPAALQDYAHTAANHGTSAHCAPAGGCTASLSAGTGSPPKHSTTSSSTHATLTDHHDNCSAYYGGSSSDACGANGSHYLDDVAYYAHTTDLRQATLPALNVAGKDLAGTQNLNVYFFYAFGTGANLMKDAAKVGGFTDLNGNNIPDLQQEWDSVNNQTGAQGGDGVPDNYFEAVDASKLQDQLMATITSILQKSASGTSVSVLATSSTGDGSLYQAYFYPLTYQGLNPVVWTGYTQGLFIDEFGNVREDTDADGRLVYEKDSIIKMRFDSSTGNVLVDEYKDVSPVDGKADSTTPFQTVGLTQIKPIWEAGRRLALTAPSARTVLTWVDANNNGVVDAGEQIPFTTANDTTLAPYLRAQAAPSPYTADNIINFVLGNEVSGLRDRQLLVTDDTGNSALQVWKMGDPINSTPTVVGAPKERYDVLYGDASYASFYIQYKSRREVAYVGANDGMLHAVNGGFYHRGDDPSTTGATEHGWFTRTATDNSSGPLLGQELWGFIPYQLLPQLQWLTQSGYTHVYYVDLKPKVTDARIFTPDADHPNGWGTILIGGFRMGGSCGACVSSTGAPPMSVTANFGSGTSTTRTFYSAYFVLDITNPEKNPVLLWSFSDTSLGLTTSYPAVVRVKPACTSCDKTDNSDAKWFVVIGSGPTGYDGSSAQTGKIFAINLQTGPIDPATGSNLFSTFTTGDAYSFMGDAITLDADLDFRTDTAYLGNAICNTAGTPCNGSAPPSWIGKLYRLATGSAFPYGVSTSPSSWGVASGTSRAPTLLLATFPPSGTILKAGPITAAPTVTSDDAHNVWVYFGTGRFYGNADKTNTDAQYFFGVKDLCMNSSDSSCQSTQKNNLLNVSAVSICTSCAGGTNQVTGVAGVTTFSDLQAKIQGTATTTAMDGWYTTLPSSGERLLSTPTVIGGAVFFTTFIPTNDICQAGGTGWVYGLFYQTGTANKEPIMGTYTGTGGGAANTACSGSSTCASRAMLLGTGLPSQVAVQVGGQGSGTSGSSSGTGCSGRITGIVQGSSGAVNQFCGKPPIASWSRYLSWINQRD